MSSDPQEPRQSQLTFSVTKSSSWVSTVLKLKRFPLAPRPDAAGVVMRPGSEKQGEALLFSKVRPRGERPSGRERGAHSPVRVKREEPVAAESGARAVRAALLSDLRVQELGGHKAREDLQTAVKD